MTASSHKQAVERQRAGPDADVGAVDDELLLVAALAQFGGDLVETDQVVANLVLPIAGADGRVDDAEERRDADRALEDADVAERFDDAAERRRTRRRCGRGR